MISNLQRYHEYKDTRLPWLSQIPGHWEVIRIKHLLREVDVRSKTGKEELLSMRQHRGFVRHNDVSQKRFKEEDLIGFKQVEPGQIVMNRMRASIGLFACPQEPGLVSPDYAVFQPEREIDLAYLIQLFKTPTMCARFRIESKGLGTGESGFLRLYTDRFGAIPIPLPPPEEQTSIVRFINEQDILINRFARNRRRLIEVLNEQKQAIINRAVTRGLDPNVRLKPSGVEWLGEIPEHWEIRRLRNVAELRVSNVDKHSKEDEIPVRLCNYTDVYKNSVITAEMPFMRATATEDEIAAFRIEVGDVIITKDSEDWRDIGVPAVVDQTADDLVCGYHLAILRPIPSVTTGRFLAYAIQSRSAVFQLNLAAKGVTRYGLSHGAIKALVLVVPPLSEQEDLVLYIDESTASLNEAISRARREIDLIREYRTRLIADVVTGKVDVRQASETTRIVQVAKPKRIANIHFQRAVFAAEIIHRLHDEPTFGHVKCEKLIFLCEKRCGVDTGSKYHRQAAGPYDNTALRSIDKQIEKQGWFAAQKVQGRYRYVPLAKSGGHTTYFNRYFQEVESTFSNVVETFRTAKTEQCEIVATLYAAWEDLLLAGEDVTENRLVEEVLTRWHPSKKRIEEERWRSAVDWMKGRDFAPVVTAVSEIEDEPRLESEEFFSDEALEADEEEMLEEVDS